MNAKPKGKGAEPLAAARAKILEAALEEVPYSGWTLQAMQTAAKSAGVDDDTAKRAFPSIGDLVCYWSKECDSAMKAKLAKRELAKMKVREKIALAVRTRLETMDKHKIAARKAMEFFAFPLHAGAGLKSLYDTCDAMWRAAGDTSTDFNFYTKRMILAGVYSRTFLVWLGDDSKDGHETEEFLAARIGEVMEFEKFKAKMKENFADWPNPLDVLAKMRYPDRKAPR